MSANDWHSLIAGERLPPEYAAIVERWWVPLATSIAGHAADRSKPLVVGISGAQGSGKSTLCRFLEALLAEHGLRTVTLSLDDFYLTHAEREALARDVHPLLVTRGVPGTHDAALIEATLDALLARQPATLRLPRFDKATDDRAPERVWSVVDNNFDVVLFEGWCIGAQPQAEADQAVPVNALERDEDPDGHWRLYVNQALQGPYAALFARLDLLAALLPPGFSEVRRNRALQEQKLAASGGPDRRMDQAALDRFLAHYERITLALLEQLPGSADYVVRLGPGHSVESIEER